MSRAAALVFACALAVSAGTALLAARDLGIPISWLGIYFDGEIYVEIAKSFPAPYADAGRAYLSHAPGYPAAIALLRVLVPSAWLDWGWLALLASWVPAAASAGVFHALCRQAGIRALPASFAYLLLYPRWIVMSASPHAEGLAMLFALLCLLAWVRRHLGPAVLWLSLAGLTRYPAFLLLLPLAFGTLVLRRDVRPRSLALLALPLLAFAAWRLYLELGVSGFPGLLEVRNVPFLRSLTWPFAALARGAARWPFGPQYLVTFASLGLFLASIPVGLRAGEADWRILPVWVAVVVLFHASLDRDLFAHAFARLAVLAWPASLLSLWRWRGDRLPAAWLLAACAAVGILGIRDAEQRIYSAVHLGDRFPWLERHREELVESDEPRWYRSRARAEPAAPRP